MRPVVFRSQRTRRRLALPLLAAIALAAAGVLMARHPHAPHDVQRGAAIAVTFALVALPLLILLFQHALTIDSRGVTGLDLGVGPVAWRDIVDAEALAIALPSGDVMRYLRLRVQNFQMYRRRAPTHFHRSEIDRVQQRRPEDGADQGALQINVSDLDADANVLAALINATALAHRRAG